MWGIVALAVEIIALIGAWFVYQQGYGVGAGGAMHMLWGLTIGSIGLIVGAFIGILGVIAGLVKTKRVPKMAVVAIIVPLGVLLLLATGKIGPL
jgi:hypothetical protein